MMTTESPSSVKITAPEQRTHLPGLNIHIYKQMRQLGVVFPADENLWDMHTQ